MTGSSRESLREEVRRVLAEQEPPRLGANDILSSLYSPAAYKQETSGKLVWKRPKTVETRDAEGLPIPPAELRMGHSEKDLDFLAAGRASASWIRRIMAREGVNLTERVSVLDWGCASGRVLRHFAEEAKRGEFWGSDESGSCMAWAKEHLSPPFKFVTCTAYPHMPFEDGKFTLIYGLSVFTHILHLSDMWLMEFRRILKPGGYALFSIHDDNTHECLRKNEQLRRLWLEHGWWVDQDFSQGLLNDVEVAGLGKSWWQVTTFFKQDWVRREWGQYLDFVSFELGLESYQTVVVLKKPQI